MTTFFAFTTGRNLRYLHQTRATAFPSLTIRHFAPKTKRVHRPRSNIAPPDSPVPNRIAVVGGGLAGLAVTYHLLHSTQRWARKRGFNSSDLNITIFDPCLPGMGGASAAAAGLLHPFSPKLKKKVWQSVKSLDAAFHLIQVAQAVDPENPIHVIPGLLRLALTENKEQDYRVAANRYPQDIEFLDANEVATRFPHVAPVPAAFLSSAAVVNTPEYLAQLWKICQDTEQVSWETQSVSNVAQLFKDGQFDTVILSAGACVKGFNDIKRVPITACRGQNLVMEQHPSSMIQSTESVPVISGKYVIPNYFKRQETSKTEVIQRKRIIAGATFEYKEEDEPIDSFLHDACKQDVQRALNELKIPLCDLVPSLFEEWNVETTTSGARALPPRTEYGSIPITCKVNGAPSGTTCWLFTGLGSRGLLHHAYLGRVLAHAVVSGVERHIPLDARRFNISLMNIGD